MNTRAAPMRRLRPALGFHSLVTLQDAARSPIEATPTTTTMHLPTPISTRPIWAVLFSLALTACGGGGGGSPAPATSPLVSSPVGGTPLSALNLSAPVPQTYRSLLVAPGSLLNESYTRLPTAAGPAYLQMWVTLPGQERPDVLWIGRWSPGSAAPTVQVPVAVKTIHFELYNAAGSVSGLWSL